jgi:hypothetical protein
VPFTDTAVRWIRPLVPSFVADAIDTATHPLRTVRQVFEEAEEITFTLRRTRRVAVDSTGTGYQATPDSHSGHAQQVAASVIDAAHQDPRYAALPPTRPGHSLATDRSPELEYHSPQQLPPAPER